jgi:phenylalanyl-tRNA synthetase beta chain
VLSASLRAAALIGDLAGGEATKGVIDCFPTPLSCPEITLRLPRASALLGIRLEPKEVKGILKRLHMEVRENKATEWIVTPPLYRSDITREIDLIEEIGRLKGYDHIPIQVPRMRVMPFRQERAVDLQERTKDTLVGLGFYEVITYSFISPQALEALQLPPGDPRSRPLPLLNPLAEVQSVMRTTLLPGLLETARYNLSHKSADLKIFELREVYYPSQGEKLPVERRALAGLVMGAIAKEGWNTPRQEADFYYVKGCVEQLLDVLRTPQPTFTRAEVPAFLNPGKAAVIKLEGEKIGALGELLPEVANAFELPPGVFIFELDLPLVTNHVKGEIAFTSLPRFPSVARDGVTIDAGWALAIMAIARG